MNRSQTMQEMRNKVKQTKKPNKTELKILLFFRLQDSRREREGGRVPVPLHLPEREALRLSGGRERTPVVLDEDERDRPSPRRSRWTLPPKLSCSWQAHQYSIVIDDNVIIWLMQLKRSCPKLLLVCKWFSRLLFSTI